MTARKKNSASDITPWTKFENAMRQIVTVPYSEIKAKLELENKVRARKRTRKSKIAAFRAANPKG
jgi:hypothetical protein